MMQLDMILNLGITIKIFLLMLLVADTQLCKRLCPSILWLVGPSVRNHWVEKWENAHFRPCPPVRNWWPCIRPCYWAEVLSVETGNWIVKKKSWASTQVSQVKARRFGSQDWDFCLTAELWFMSRGFVRGGRRDRTTEFGQQSILRISLSATFEKERKNEWVYENERISSWEWAHENELRADSAH